jgi:hypothetical protein
MKAQNFKHECLRAARIGVEELFALTPALSHPMGEGESCAVVLKDQSAGFAAQSNKSNGGFESCSLSRRTGEGQDEGRCEFQIAFARVGFQEL